MQRKFPQAVVAGLLGAVLTSAGTVPLFAQSTAAQDKRAPAKKAASVVMPKVGDVAPDFKLHYFDGNDLKDVSLSEYRGKKNVVLAFFIFAFTGG